MSKLQKQGGVPFTQINNDLLNDHTLSAKAKGIYCYLYSKPDDRDFSCERICDEFDDGVKSIETGVRELEASGWISRAKQPDGRMIYTIFWDKNQIVPNQPNRQKGGLGGISNTDIISNDKEHISIYINNILYDNVYLTYKDYDILLNKYNKESLEKNIISLSQYLKKTRKVYKNHYLTLNKWMSKEKKLGRLAVPVSSDAQKIYDTIKKYSDRVDWNLEDCEKLKIALVDTYPDKEPVKFVNDMILAMIKSWQSAFYSIANPASMTKNLGTIITKIKTKLGEDNKPTTVGFKDGKMVLS